MRCSESLQKQAWDWAFIETKENAGQWSLSEVLIQPKINNSFAARKAAELQKRWERLTKKIDLMQEQYDNETRAEEKLRIDYLLEGVLEDRAKVEKEMDAG